MMPSCHKLVVLTAVLLSLAALSDGVRSRHRNRGRDSREGKFLSVFNVVTFQNVPCTATGGLTGTCLTASQCSSRSGGMALGNCASGFGVCCFQRVNTCGSTVTNNCTYVQNPGYPSAYTGTTCSYTVKELSNICQIRLDYNMFAIQGPNLAVTGEAKCDIDNWTVRGANNQEAIATTTTLTTINPPVICGIATGQHIYVDVGGSNTADLTLTYSGTGTTANRRWNVKVSQIPCGVDYAPPARCQQYLMGVSGNVKSFNFDVTNENEYAHLPQQNYRVCVRQEPGYCGLRWHPSTEPNSFHISGDATTAISGTGSTGCTNDYVIIPSGTQKAQVGCSFNTGTYFVDSIDRYCGARLACNRRYRNVPVYSEQFYINVYFDNQDSTNNAATPPVLQLNRNRGFSLNWLQVPCGETT